MLTYHNLTKLNFLAVCVALLAIASCGIAKSSPQKSIHIQLAEAVINDDYTKIKELQERGADLYKEVNGKSAIGLYISNKPYKELVTLLNYVTNDSLCSGSVKAKMIDYHYQNDLYKFKYSITAPYFYDLAYPKDKVKTLKTLNTKYGMNDMSPLSIVKNYGFSLPVDLEKEPLSNLAEDKYENDFNSFSYYSALTFNRNDIVSGILDRYISYRDGNLLDIDQSSYLFDIKTQRPIEAISLLNTKYITDISNLVLNSFIAYNRADYDAYVNQVDSPKAELVLNIQDTVSDSPNIFIVKGYIVFMLPSIRFSQNPKGQILCPVSIRNIHNYLTQYGISKVTNKGL